MSIDLLVLSLSLAAADGVAARTLSTEETDSSELSETKLGKLVGLFNVYH